MNLDLIVGGTTYSLDDGTYCYLKDYDNIGEVPRHRIEEQGPQQHGATDVGFRLDPRDIPITLEILGTSRSDQESKRQSLARMFKPTNTAKTLKWTLEDGSIRYIQGHSLGAMTMLTQPAPVLGFNIVAGLVFRAADPTFYDPAVEAVTINPGGGSGTFAVPTPVPTSVGASTIDSRWNLTNDGDWLAYPRIRVVGPIADCIIENETTSETLSFNGDTIADGHYYDIDLRYGVKTITDDDGTTSQLDELTSASDLATWHLDPAPEAAGGVNVIHITGSGINGNTQITFTWYHRYLGI